MHRTRRLWFSLGLMGLAGAAAPAPVVVQGGDLYLRQGGGQVKLTNYGHNLSAEVSPDGQYVAYSSESTALVQSNAKNAWVDSAGAPMVYNIWLMNLKTKAAWKLADQPANIRLNGHEDSLNYIERSHPVWSADGSQIFWIEVSGRGTNKGYEGQCRVASYNLKMRQIAVIPLTSKGIICLENGVALNQLMQGPIDTVFGYYDLDALAFRPGKWLGRATITGEGPETAVRGPLFILTTNAETLTFDARTNKFTRQKR